MYVFIQAVCVKRCTVLYQDHDIDCASLVKAFLSPSAVALWNKKQKKAFF